MADAADADKKRRLRSPAYPYINLETAIKRAREFYAKEGRNAANIRVAVRHWGYEEKSSGGTQTAAALISFGLMKDEGTGERRNLLLTPSALRIILDADPNSSPRTNAIKVAALAPKIHRELWHKWGTAVPSDLSLKNILTLEWDPPFNDNAVDGFIREYKDTIAFAKLDESDLRSGQSNGDPDEVEKSEGKTVVSVPVNGSYVQWEPNGILQFKEPKRITRLSSDGKFAFVEGSSTGLPISELKLESGPEDVARTKDVHEWGGTSRTKAVMREDVFSLMEGNVTFQWPTPLSPDSIADLKDWLRILERKISRSLPQPKQEQSNED